MKREGTEGMDLAVKGYARRTVGRRGTTQGVGGDINGRTDGVNEGNETTPYVRLGDREKEQPNEPAQVLRKVSGG